jgi:transcriptional regulator with XRE-family HTH domain
MPPSRHLTTYKTLGALLRDYRRTHRIKQARLAKEIEIDQKTLSRWEGGSSPGHENLLRLAQHTIFPIELLLRLAYEIPTLYNVKSHRMAYSGFDTDFVNRKLLQKELFVGGPDTTIEVTQARDSLAHVLRRKRQIYTEARWVADKVVGRASELAPPLNLVAHGYGQTYVGHLLVLPVNKSAYQALRSQGRRERQIELADLVDLHAPDLGALHIYSLHASTSHVAYILLQRMIIALLQSWDQLEKKGCYLTRYTVTEDGLELSSKMEMREVFTDVAEHRSARTEVVPEFREARIGSENLSWIHEYRGAIRL